MSGANQVDIVEEDAADLQFPKDHDFIEIKQEPSTVVTTRYYTLPQQIESFNSSGCEKCSLVLEEPFVCCAECNQLFCLNCFSRGAETKIHRNTHSYIIRHNSINVFPQTNWSAGEEKQLLNLILALGYGNWEEISKSMNNRLADECREHYVKCYFDGIFEKTLGLTNRNCYIRSSMPFLIKMNSLDPPRCDTEMPNFKTMAGYRFARSDFDTPYDNSAEALLNHTLLDVEDDPENIEAIDELNCALFRAYNHRKKERCRRYKMIRDHGLIVQRKTLAWLTKYADALKVNKTNQISTGRFIAFMQITDGMSFDFLVESLKFACDTKKYLQRLYELRNMGIRSFAGGKMFYKLRIRRFNKIRDKRVDHYESSIDWKKLIPGNIIGSSIPLMNDTINPMLPARRKAMPLDVLGLPGYEKLTDDEKLICSQVRLPPVVYMDYKKILLAENASTGYLRLADARKLVKIDVNKTRQLYDFFLKHGFINAPLS